MRKDDVTIVAAACGGTPAALDRLCARWLPVVLAWTARLGGPLVDPEDAAHEVFLVVLRRLHELERPESFESWLYGVTRRVLASHRRGGWLRRWLDVVLDPVDPTPEPHDALERRRRADRVWAALDALPLHHREVLVLCDVEERADSEVAELVGVPRGTVKSRLRRARQAVRERLGEDRELLGLPSRTADA